MGQGASSQSWNRFQCTTSAMAGSRQRWSAIGVIGVTGAFLLWAFHAAFG